MESGVTGLPQMDDITQSLQQKILEAAKSGTSDRLLSIEIPKGDYAIQMLTVPKSVGVLLFSKDRVRLLYAGKRNRPMFVLEENSTLVLREKIEIYYNTNNVQEVSNLMVRVPKSGRVDIPKEVKISLFSLKQEQ